jgi:tetratricopeptide (TPR) repeat protein
MKAAWRSGQRPVAEDFLTRHPELYSHPDDALRLIHEEICLRQEFGLQANSVAIVNRFPQWQAKLRFLLDCRSLFRPNPDASASPIVKQPVPTPPIDADSARSSPQQPPGQAGHLTEQLAREMRAAWQRGERPVAEDFFKRHPELHADPEGAVRLVYEEICVRQEFGPAATSQEVRKRFPQWQAQLQFLLEFRDILPSQANSIAAVRQESISLTAQERKWGSVGPDSRAKSGEAEALAARLAEEMKAAWRRGERLVAEDFLKRHPELHADPHAAVRLIYEEVCLRHEAGEQVASVEVLKRFPQWQAELRFLLDCHGVLRSSQKTPIFPSIGDTWTEFYLIAELGRGTFGRVFLATQPSLADRPVVLKITAGDVQEHLSLARLQHTHIVPLYAVQDDHEQHLRALCMPYFGGTSFDRILEALKDKSAVQRTGKDLLDVMDKVQANSPVAVPLQGPARLYLARSTYVQALCWIGACLAEALHYAHERGLAHYDIKPGNVLLAADGQPMLLDFNLARGPLRAGDPTPDWFGGTPEYMSPEQRRVLAEMQTRPQVLTPVDGQSDIYSLGLVLYEALGGPHPLPAEKPQRELYRCNPQVSVGLSDVIHKCLALEPSSRYTDAALLAGDLRRHLFHLRLRGVRNRSLRERWRKWRRRQPHALALTGMALALLTAALAAAVYGQGYIGRRLHEAETALAEGREQFNDHAYPAAVRTLARGLALAENVPGGQELGQRLASQLRLAQRAHAARQLHVLADRIRFHLGANALSSKRQQELDAHCRTVWETRGLLTGRTETELGAMIEQQIRTDFLDLAILWAELQVSQATGTSRVNQARQEALRLLDEAEAQLGPSILLAREQQAYAEALGQTERAESAARRAADLKAKSAWEHCALGRSLLRPEVLPQAMLEFEQALDLEPQAFWPNFYSGLCAYRLRRYEDAVGSFRVCLALSPDCAECFYNRALAETALGRRARALHDYDRALQLDPGMAAAALNRGILYYQAKRFREALADFQRALDNGAETPVVYYNSALAHLGNGDRQAALASLGRVLELDRRHKEAQQLYQQLSGKR